MCNDKVYKIREMLKSLSAEERLQVLQSELSDCGLTVVFGGSSRTSAQICVNIYNSKELAIDEILQGVADYLRKSNND